MYLIINARLVEITIGGIKNLTEKYQRLKGNKKPDIGHIKDQLILKANFQFSFEPKNQQKYFCISALAPRKWLKQKI